MLRTLASQGARRLKKSSVVGCPAHA